MAQSNAIEPDHEAAWEQTVSWVEDCWQGNVQDVIGFLTSKVNYRVKGTEKFWNDGQQIEAMLQIVTAILGDEDQLAKHFQGRNGSPYDRSLTKKELCKKH